MKLISIIILLCLVEKSTCMEDDKSLCKERLLHYRSVCRDIEKKRQDNFAKFKTKCCSSGDVDKICTLLKKYKHKLDFYKLEIVQEKEDSLSSLQNEFNIPADLWNDCINKVTSAQILSNDYLVRGFSDVTHEHHKDLKIIIKLLRENCINPNAINIKMIGEIGGNSKEEKILSIVSEPMPELFYENNTIVVDDTLVSPGLINISSLTFIYPLADRKAIYAHEVGHLIKKHHCERRIIRKYLQVIGFSVDTIYENIMWRNFVRKQEAEAELTLAVNSADMATVFLLHRRNYFYPKHLFENHYRKLNEIVDCWNKISFLEEKVLPQLIENLDISKEWLSDKMLKKWQKHNAYQAFVLTDAMPDPFLVLKLLSSGETIDDTKNNIKYIQKMLYYFFDAILKGNVIYRAIKDYSSDKNVLQIIPSNYCSLDQLRALYGKNALFRAIVLANKYALQKIERRLLFIF